MTVSILVIIDDVWGWQRLLAKVRYLFGKHGVTPVIVISQTPTESTLRDHVNIHNQWMILPFEHFQGICVPQHRFLHIRDVGAGWRCEGSCWSV